MNLPFFRRKLPFLYRIFLYFSLKKDEKKLIGKKISYGNENPEKSFLIIKIINPILGLMAIYNSVCGYLRIAEKRGLIPIVDLMNYDNGYLEKSEIGKKNAWEYYFEQPSEYNLNEVYRSKNVYLASGIAPTEAYPGKMKFLLQNRKKSAYYYKLLSNNIRIKDSLVQKINLEYFEIINGRRVIGVISRGSDLINKKGHAKQLSTDNLIRLTKRKLQEWNCKYVFLASEEEYVVALFKDHFADRLLINNCCRIDNFNKYDYLVNISFHRENDKYLKGLEYLTTVVILSKCNCLIGSLTGTTTGALAMNQNCYENKYIYDLGVYN